MQETTMTCCQHGMLSSTWGAAWTASFPASPPSPPCPLAPVPPPVTPGLVLIAVRFPSLEGVDDHHKEEVT